MNKPNLQTEVIETIIYNEKPELKKLDCARCGGSLRITNQTHAICPHCGRNYKIQHAEKIKIDVTIDSKEMKKTQSVLSKTLVILGTIFVLIIIIIVNIVRYNIGMR